MNRVVTTAILAAVLAHIPASVQAGPTPTSSPPPAVRGLPTETKPWSGDFDGMLERRAIRVLVPYSRSLYFNDRGRERGIAADTVRGFETWLNSKYAK